MSSYDHGVTQEELDEFDSKSDISVVIDIGAKDNIEYLKLKPKASFHLFEPRPESYKTLVEKVSNLKIMPDVIVNYYGIGDMDGRLAFNTTHESFEGSRATPSPQGEYTLPIRTLDSYIEENKITKIDFIKIDAEGMEYKIIKGNPKSFSLPKYIQYEYWDNDEDIRSLLPDFTFKDLGCRNIFCTRK